MFDYNVTYFIRYLMGGRTFSCLDAVINRYKTEQILEGHTLGAPVCKAVSDIKMLILTFNICNE